MLQHLFLPNKINLNVLEFPSVSFLIFASSVFPFPVCSISAFYVTPSLHCLAVSGCSFLKNTLLAALFLDTVGQFVDLAAG